MRIKQVWPLVKDAIGAWSDDYAPSMGAALSYYTLFSIAPLLLIVIAVAGFFFGEQAARGEIMGQLQGLMGESGAKAIEAMLASVKRPEQGLVATVAGIAVLLVGASTVFGELQNDLDRIWRAPAREKKAGWWTLIRTRILSFGMILGLGFLLMVSLVVNAALSALGRWWAPMFGAWIVLAYVVNIVVSFGLLTAIFAMIYKFMPRVTIAWHDVWVGAAVTALLFTIGKFLIGLYLGKSSVASGFGAAGSLVVVMLWVYYSAQIFLLGAEFTWVYSHAVGSRRGEARPGATRAALPPRTDVAGVAPSTPHGVPAIAAQPLSGAMVSAPPALGVTPGAPASVHAKIVLRQNAFAALGVAAAVGLVAGAFTVWKKRKTRHAIRLATAGEHAAR